VTTQHIVAGNFKPEPTLLADHFVVPTRKIWAVVVVVTVAVLMPIIALGPIR
jgi:hypothetical protein